MWWSPPPQQAAKRSIYNLPVMENILNNPDSKALYIFPLKALAQDQLRTFEANYSKYSKGETPKIADL